MVDRVNVLSGYETVLYVMPLRKVKYSVKYILDIGLENGLDRVVIYA